MDQIVKILEEAHPWVDYYKETALIDDGILDSLSISTVVIALNHKFGIHITLDDIIPENFNAAGSIFALVERYQQQDAE